MSIPILKPSDLSTIEIGDRFTEMLSYFVQIVWKQDDLLFFTDTTGEVGIMREASFKQRFDWVYLCDRGNEYIEEIIPRFENGNKEKAHRSDKVPQI